MNATDMLQKVGETLGSTATVKSVFGEPIHAEGRTVVPVARVAYGFGGGFGTGTGRGKRGAATAPAPGAEGAEPSVQGEGGGGGGGVTAFPAGALEITENHTRFIPFWDMRWLAVAFAAGATIGTLAGGLRRRKT
jgi:uncharacterized spore protein YtfJ